ncbi:hypothetical protein [Kitasatospora purpeofusca]|uniref:hypothetical protein n=1 Tax=Kitasatospora purpeofusca TaxID=67352 RepID=UPI0022512F94|nr:hypothetical protein [Kitasatospora purpeofusca]
MEPRCPFSHVLDPHAADLHAEAAHLRTHGPAVRVELPGKVLAWSVTRAEVARRLLADHRLAKNARRHWPEWIDGRVGPDWPLASWVAVESMFTSDGEDHHRLRTLTAPAFGPHRVEALRPRVRAIVAALLVVGDPPRQPGPAVRVEGQAVVVALAAVDPRPYPAHHAPDVRVRAVRTTDDLAGIALLSDLLALPNRRPSRRGVPGGEAREATRRQPPESHTQHPWATQPYEWPDQPVQQGRAA